jgi:hypothetical protein
LEAASVLRIVHFVARKQDSLSPLKLNFLVPRIAIFEEIFEALLEGLRFSALNR